MSKTAALFSGQGSQYQGMGKELFDKLAYVREIYACGSGVLGYDLAEKSFTSGADELADTLLAQPAIFALSVAAFTAAKNELGFEPVCTAGHSLGEYAALCCAGAYSLEDGFRIIKARAQAMSKASGGDAAMYAIRGGDEDSVREACDAVDGFVVPVNFNMPSQTVISGKAEPAAKAAAALAEKGAKAVKLNVSGAFHTILMREAADEFKSKLSDIKFSATKLKFYSNLVGDALEINDYPDYFAKHMVSPVLFSSEIKKMEQDGVTCCVEFGPKHVVASLAKKNVKSLSVFGVEDLASLENLRKGLGE